MSELRRRLMMQSTDEIVLDARTGVPSDVKLMDIFYNNLHIAKNPLYLTKKEAEAVISGGVYGFPFSDLNRYDPDNIVTDLSVLQYFTGISQFYYTAWGGRIITKIVYPPSITDCRNTELKGSVVSVLEMNSAPPTLNRDFQAKIEKIIVPSEYLNDYKTKKGWNYYSRIYEGK